MQINRKHSDCKSAWWHGCTCICDHGTNVRIISMPSKFTADKSNLKQPQHRRLHNHRYRFRVQSWFGSLWDLIGVLLYLVGCFNLQSYCRSSTNGHTSFGWSFWTLDYSGLCILWHLRPIKIVNVSKTWQNQKSLTYGNSFNNIPLVLLNDYILASNSNQCINLENNLHRSVSKRIQYTDGFQKKGENCYK